MMVWSWWMTAWVMPEISAVWRVPVLALFRGAGDRGSSGDRRSRARATFAAIPAAVSDRISVSSGVLSRQLGPRGCSHQVIPEKVEGVSLRPINPALVWPWDDFQVIRIGESFGVVQPVVSAGLQFFRQELVGDFFDPDVLAPAPGRDFFDLVHEC